ncbi:hypothetical protein D3C81_1508740 [compost metagenome]
MALPPRGAHYQIAFLKLGIERALDATDSATGHYIADFYRSGVGRCVAHASAHVGVQRQVKRLEQHLAISQVGQCDPLQAEILRRRRAHRA